MDGLGLNDYNLESALYQIRFPNPLDQRYFRTFHIIDTHFQFSGVNILILTGRGETMDGSLRYFVKFIVSHSLYPFSAQIILK